MLRTLFTPLRAHFDSSPRTPQTLSVPGQDDELAPEDFARDVMIELMRNSMENLKLAQDTSTKAQVLSEIHIIMMQNGNTKDVFREMDGFLVLMSVLSNVHDCSEDSAVEPEKEALSRVMEITSLIFRCMSEAMNEHLENAEYFQTAVGYDPLADALQSLVSDTRTVDMTLGLLFSFAIHNFGASDIFSSIRGTQEEKLEGVLDKLESRLGTIRRPGAIRILWNSIPHLTAGNASMRYAVLKLFEFLSRVSHRNRTILSSLGLVKSLFDRFCDARSDPTVSEKERHTLQKLLRRLLDMGVTTSEARVIFQKVIRSDETLDTEVLDIIRFGMKSRWLEHFSMESPAALLLSEDNMRGLPVAGFTFMAWIWISELPSSSPHVFFAVKLSSRSLLTMSIHPDGYLGLFSSANPQPAIFSKSKIHRSRWTHVTLIHYPYRASNPSIRLFVDGILTDTLNWNYPGPESSAQLGTYEIGDISEKASMSWCLASSYLLSAPLGDDLPRLVHHLGPRYFGKFQASNLIKFLTYEASTSLNMFLATIASKNTPSSTISPLVKAVKDGLGVSESSITFSVSPHSFRDFRMEADVFVVKAACLDMALWKIGGAAVALRLVQVANTPHELSRALGVLTDGLKNSWQNSEDMERLRGYEILADILRGKSQMINISGFETLFEFLGLNFRSPEQSTIVNTLAYRAIALDFELWSRTRKEIQRVYLEHFTTVLQTSRFRKFNVWQRFAKIGLVRRFLFILQTDWFQQDMIPFLMDALKAAVQAHFTKDETIKPIVSYLAANLHETSKASGSVSPRSVISPIGDTNPQAKAEHVLELLVSTLSTKSYHVKFAAALPLTRILLLLLGDRPSPVVATHVLSLIGISISFSSSFTRKFELVSGWSILKAMLPYCWDLSVHRASIDILLGRCSYIKGLDVQDSNIVVCPNIVPAIISAMHTGLIAVANNSQASDAGEASSAQCHWTTESNMELLIEQFMDLHASSPTFRQVFRSQQTTQQFVDAYKSFVSKVIAATGVNQWTNRILEKLTHFGLTLALDVHIAGSQKREILEILQSAERFLDPAANKLSIDPGLVVDSRSVRQRIASARFSMQVGEKAIIKTIARMAEWRKSIQVSERKRLRKMVLDLRETQRQISCLYEWTHLLSSERGLWPRQETRLWRLDETEGPYRIRKRLEPQNDKAPSSRVDAKEEHDRDVQAPAIDTTPVNQVEVPPWAESYDISATEMDDKQLAEDIAEDKHRRVRHELEPGDVIEAVGTVARIAGVDSFPGLLIIGRTHLYMLDGLVENDDGEVIEAHEAPKHLFFLPGSIVELDGPQRAQRWSHDQIATYGDKTFLFRDVALEIYFKDSRSLLIVFLAKQTRVEIDQRLAEMVARHSSDSTLTPGLPRTPKPRMGSKVLSGLLADELLVAQRRWQSREISNFTYLSILNQISGRTPSDATQYPVFPWVLKDYTSRILDLDSPDSYRDLTKPMGALTPARKEAAETRYVNLQSVDEEPFHYGTHFSSSMIVCHFLIRISPFANMFKTLQGGDWDLPDRLFSDLPRAYESAAQDVRGDVRELIPEFYTFPEFLENSADLDFGIQHSTGERIHHVNLPPWAHKDPLLFVTLNRQALESSYVSERLPAWIDLIWGCKQRDPESVNVFHPLSYEGSIDLENITDELEREATVGIIHNFGQTPRKLFNAPHPQRLNHGLATLPVGVLHGIEEDPYLLVQGNRCFKDLGPNTPVRSLVLDIVGENIIPCPEGALCAPLHPHEQIEWHPGGTELWVTVDQKVVQVIENAYCNCATFADPQCLVTGSSDYTVRLWKVSRNSVAFSNGATHLTLSHIMRIHTHEVTCIAASRTWSIALSGSKDGSAALWDLNRGVYIRSIWHDTGEGQTAVNLVAINESTGYIATCSQLKLCLHTINARPMATLDLTTTSSFSRLVPTITALAFHEREYSHHGVLATGGPDGSITLRTWTTDGTLENEKARWEFIVIRTMKARIIGRGVTRPPSITSLKFLGEALCHGEETGKSYMWRFPDS